MAAVVLQVSLLLAAALTPAFALKADVEDPQSDGEDANRAEDSGKPQTIDAITVQNRAFRNSIKEWVADKDIDASISSYGLTGEVTNYSGVPDPHKFKVQVAWDTGKYPTQHDFISQIGSRIMAKHDKGTLFQKRPAVRYMEVGVGVMKCTHTQAHFLKKASITAVDYEDPNPTISNLWGERKTLAVWDKSTTPEGIPDQRRKKGFKTDFLYQWHGPNKNKIQYVAADAYNDATWEHVKKYLVDEQGPMNLVVSERATQQAVTHEVNKLLTSGVIAYKKGEDFTMIWDDCEGPMMAALYGEIRERLVNEFSHGHRVCFGWFTIRGWRGSNEPEHKTCVFSTFDLSGGSYLQAGDTWKPSRINMDCRFKGPV